MTSEQVRKRLWKSIEKLARCTTAPIPKQIERQTEPLIRYRVELGVWLDPFVLAAVRAEAIKTVLDAREER